MRLQELSGSVVDMIQAVVQREETDTDTIICCDAALKELAAQRLEVSHKEKVRCLHHVLDGPFTQSDLCKLQTDTHICR